MRRALCTLRRHPVVDSTAPATTCPCGTRVRILLTSNPAQGDHVADILRAHARATHNTGLDAVADAVEQRSQELRAHG